MFVLECDDIETLASFYADLLGGEARWTASSDFIEITGPGGVLLALHRHPGYTQLVWPKAEDPHDAHLYIFVDAGDMDAAEREAIGLGARPVEARDDNGREGVRVFADPSGHTFALSAS
ncbi:VOC family protein [Streptomyces boninensis]|uniref:VOC family protein n=1 Tax=Streptomyces boninensis TaxID=2039455 RepID=UPI003B21A3AC